MIIPGLLSRLTGFRSKVRSKVKVIVVGNCQARPLAKILTLLNPNIEVIAVAVVHLLKSEEANHYFPLFEEADFIVAQLVADNYPCDFVRTHVLQEVFADKLIRIVNLYYSGYNPELLYIRKGSAGTLKSPLAEYHNKTFLDTWKEGGSVEDALERHLDVGYNQEKYSSLVSESFNELKRRESLVDIAVTDLIEDNLHKKRLFFTFNHPCKTLLVEMSKRILQRMELKVNPLESLSDLKEPLDKIIVPVNSFTQKYLDLQFSDVDTFKGVECAFDSNGHLLVSGSYSYLLPEIVKKYYEIYDRNLSI